MPISAESKREVPLLAVLTLVLWTVTCSVAAVGVLVPYIRPKAVEKKEMIVTAETLKVELTSEPIATVPEEVASTSQPEPPDLDSVVRPMEELSFTAVADPKLVQFAMPVEGPIRLVEVKAAAFAAPSEPIKTNVTEQTIPAPQQLIYGRGDGLQPEPEYPYRAKREGQEGVVKVRFLVGEDGRVISAEAASPSPWPMLNDSAVRAVRERWRFRAGAVRNYEVAIKFQLR